VKRASRVVLALVLLLGVLAAYNAVQLRRHARECAIQFFASTTDPQVRCVQRQNARRVMRTIRIGNATIVTTPSTSVQFRPDAQVFEVDNVAPGLRIIDLNTNGDVSSWVERMS
jgi:hypothetical protein